MVAAFLKFLFPTTIFSLKTVHGMNRTMCVLGGQVTEFLLQDCSQPTNSPYTYTSPLTMRESSSAITQCLACEASARHNATCPSIFGILMPPCRLLHDHAMPMRIRRCSLKQAVPKTLDDILEPGRSQRTFHKSRSEGMSMNFVTGQSLNRRKHIRRKHIRRKQ